MTVLAFEPLAVYVIQACTVTDMHGMHASQIFTCDLRLFSHSKPSLKLGCLPPGLVCHHLSTNAKLLKMLLM